MRKLLQKNQLLIIKNITNNKMAPICQNIYKLPFEQNFNNFSVKLISKQRQMGEKDKNNSYILTSLNILLHTYFLSISLQVELKANIIYIVTFI